jgi:hypothetical protein
VANGNGTAVLVDLARINLEVLDRKDGLRSKGLVDLEKVNVVLFEARLLEDLG